MLYYTDTVRGVRHVVRQLQHCTLYRPVYAVTWTRPGQGSALSVLIANTFYVRVGEMCDKADAVELVRDELHTEPS